MEITRIDFDKPLVNFSGLPLKEGNETLTLKMVATEALLRSENGLHTGEKLLRYDLSKRIFKGESEFTGQEIVKIKHCIGNSFFPLIVGAAFELIDGTKPDDESQTEKSDFAGCEP